MGQLPTNPIDTEELQLELRKKESAATTIPYISFILTHAAIVLFIVALLLVDRLVTSPSTNITIKVVLVVVGVLLLACEWIYAIFYSLNWKRDILTLQHIKEEQRRAEEEARQRFQEAALAAERQRNQALQFDLQQQRKRVESMMRPTSTVRSVRFQPPPAMQGLVVKEAIRHDNDDDQCKHADAYNGL